MSALPTSPRPPEGAGVNSLLPRSRRHLRDICLVSGAWSWPLRRLPSPDSCVSLRGWPAVPSNTVAQESRREPSGRAGLLCTHLSGVHVRQTLVSLAACAVCVCVGGCRMVSEPRQAAHGGHQRTVSLAQSLSAVSDLVVAATVPSPQGVAANISAGTFKRVSFLT